MGLRLILLIVSCVIVVMALLLTAGKVLPILALPIVIIGAVLSFTIVGAFQQRQDERLSEKAFLQLMLTTLKNLPLVLRRGDTSDSSK
jgi:hypothetical protein